MNRQIKHLKVFQIKVKKEKKKKSRAKGRSSLHHDFLYIFNKYLKYLLYANMS